jgi:hypothetical protein
MKPLVLVCVLLAAACSADIEPNNYPVLPQSGQPIPGGAIGNRLRGKVCLISDPRMLDACAPTGAGGLDVALGAEHAITAADGSFAIEVPPASNLSFVVTGPNIVTSRRAFGVVSPIPVFPTPLFTQLIVNNNVTATAGTGSVITQVVGSDGLPLAGVGAVAAPAPGFGPFFDGVDPTVWHQGMTGIRGVVWFPGVNIGPVDLTFDERVSGTESTVAGVQVYDGGITFVDAVLP